MRGPGTDLTDKAGSCDHRYHYAGDGWNRDDAESERK